MVTLDRRTGRLHAANLGDSGFMIVRVFHFVRERSLVSLGFRSGFSLGFSLGFSFGRERSLVSLGFRV